MEVIAKARYIRMSPRKVRLVADLVRGLDVTAAEAQLRFYRKAAAMPVLKAILSAKANAEHNFKIAPGVLYVKRIMVDGGPTLDRWRARAFGRAASIIRRSAHITVILDERALVKGEKSAVAAAAVAVPAKSGEAKTEKKTRRAKPASKAKA